MHIPINGIPPRANTIVARDWMHSNGSTRLSANLGTWASSRGAAAAVSAAIPCTPRASLSHLQVLRWTRPPARRFYTTHWLKGRQKKATWTAKKWEESRYLPSFLIFSEVFSWKEPELFWPCWNLFPIQCWTGTSIWQNSTEQMELISICRHQLFLSFFRCEISHLVNKTRSSPQKHRAESCESAAQCQSMSMSQVWFDSMNLLPSNGTVKCCRSAHKQVR